MPEPNASTAGAEPANQPPPCLRFPLPMSQEVLEAFPFPLLISTCDGLAIGANDLVGQLFRISKDVLIGRFNLLTDPLPHANRVRDLFQAAVAGQRVQAPRLSYDFSFPGTETAGPPGCWVETTFLPFRDATGRVTHVGTLIQDVTARVDFEREATMFQTLVEHASDGIAVTTLDGRVTYSNPAYQALTGYGAATTGMPIAAMHPEAFATQAADMALLLEQGQVRSQMPTRRADGSSFPADVSAFLLRDHTGQPTGSAAILRDLTAQQAQEQRLRMFEALVEHAPVGMALTDLAGTYTYANATLRATYGYGDDIVGMSIPMLLPAQPQAGAGMQMKMAELFTHGRMTVETAFRCRDMRLRPTTIQAFLIRGEVGTPVATAAIIRDLTEEHARTQELQLSKLSLDRSPDTIHWIDSRSRIVYVNDGACASLGYTRTELLSLTVADIDPVLPMHDWEAIWSQLKQQGILTRESLHRHKDGWTFPVDMVVSFLEFEGREYASVIARDISARKRHEAELRSFKAMVENTPDAIAIVDGKGVYQYVNPAYQAMLCPEKDLIGQQVMHFLVEEDQQTFAAVLINLAEQRTAFVQARYRRVDGSTFPTAAAIFYQETPEGEPQIIGFVRDITEQQRAAEERAAFQQQVIAAQQAALRELSTPLIPIAEGVVAMPLIGSIDSGRAQLVIETLLTGVATLRAETIILDITGVPVVDTQVANALLRAAQAVKLLGARVILTGIRPEVAQTLVGLGVDLSGIITRSTLQDGVAEALGRQAGAALTGRSGRR